MYTSGTPKRTERPVCASLGPSDEVLTSGLHDTTKKHARKHSLFLIRGEKRKNEHYVHPATAERRCKEKKGHGRRSSNLFVSCVAQNLASTKHTHILGLTHAQTKSQLRSETE